MTNLYVPPESEKVTAYCFGEVTGITGGKALVKWDGEDEAMRKAYRHLAPYTPAVGDRACAVKVSGTYLLIGKVV